MPKSGTITNRTVKSVAFSDHSILLRSDDCQALTRHEPDEDVTYKPETGPGTVPADLRSGPDFNDRVRNFDLPLRVDLDRRLSIRPDGSRRPIGAEGVIGTIAVRDGVVYFDGERLGGDEVRGMRDACVASAGARKRK
ncbi:hypothetical protein [Govanella unica]|uniref:Uncharacterized protein n=1 Tax=Govanella unica TaxID=2975056 RepID=A0A9X3Z765_9PROT|nr:hypothetical protein [Govania unica]MDA5193758.1 hypothetical protein [Govania unica]